MEENRFYGFSQKRIIRIVMCGGCKEWWNYVLEFKQGYDNLNGYKLYREDSDGIKFMGGQLIVDLEGETCRHTFMDTSSGADLKEDEGFVDYETFFTEN